MESIEKLFDEIQRQKASLRDLKEMLKTQLSKNAEYGLLVNDIRELSDKRKQIVRDAMNEMRIAEDMERLTKEIKSGTILLNDMLIEAIRHGDDVEIKLGKFTYKPQMSFTFTKQQSLF